MMTFASFFLFFLTFATLTIRIKSLKCYSKLTTADANGKVTASSLGNQTCTGSGAQQYCVKVSGSETTTHDGQNMMDGEVTVSTVQLPLPL